MRWVRRPEPWVFVLLLGSYAYFWQSRDWNSASRLMLTYAVVDRGTVAIDGLEDQTRDRAQVQGHFYTDKLPGFSLAAALPYAAAKLALRLPAHPLGRKGFAYWPADYWVTLGTSGVFTALTAVVLIGLARDVGCSPRRAALVALAYGLGTPAYAYATMSYGHQAAAFSLLSAFALLRRPGAPRPSLRAGLAGFLAASASAVELGVGPVSAVLGTYLLVQTCLGDRKFSTVGDFAVGASIPTLVLLGYNQLAFGSPWEMGYFHLTTKEFADVHSEANPFGLGRLDLTRAKALLWGRYRGLLFYAPIVALTPLGMVSLVKRREWAVLTVSAAAMVAVFLVNLSYSAWTGGWSTGPRLLVPLLPFAMLPAASWVGRGGRFRVAVAAVLTAAGAVLMLLFVGVGARVPQYYSDPFVQAVWPIWTGADVPGWPGQPFARNVLTTAFPGWVDALPRRWRGAQFLPLVLGQALLGLAMIRLVARQWEDATAKKSRPSPPQT